MFHFDSIAEKNRSEGVFLCFTLDDDKNPHNDGLYSIRLSFPDRTQQESEIEQISLGFPLLLP